MNLLQGKWPRLATLLAVLVAAALVFLAWERYTRTPWTRDARVRADVVTLSADVSGLITRLPLSDNQPVEKGELLLSIDPARYELAVLRAERAVNVARAALGESRAAIEASQAQLRQRRSEAQRRSALQKRSMLSVEENEKAQTDVSLAQAELLRNQASLGLAQANVELAEAALQQARLDLERTQVRAPVSGYVTNLQTREGDYAHAGVPLLALVDRDSFYVSGYFEETKLPGIRVGSRARVELAEQALEAARIGLELEREVLSGTVRMTCSDAVLHGLLLPALARFMPGYPALQLELATSNDFANLSRRDADIALRMTRTPPEHLVGRNLGEVRYVLCASERYLEGRDATEPAMLHWIAPDDFLPDHPSVVWRRRHYPGVLPAYRCNGVLAVAEMARAGLGLAAIPAYLLRDGDGLRVLDADLEGCASALWLLTRPDCRALRSVVALFDELGRHVRLGDE